MRNYIVTRTSLESSPCPPHPSLLLCNSLRVCNSSDTYGGYGRMKTSVPIHSEASEVD